MHSFTTSSLDTSRQETTTSHVPPRPPNSKERRRALRANVLAESISIGAAQCWGEEPEETSKRARARLTPPARDALVDDDDMDLSEDLLLDGMYLSSSCFCALLCGVSVTI